MSETTQPENWPSPRGPWPEVSDLSRRFDHGRHWCANAAGHPHPEGGYPDAGVHVPWDECQSAPCLFDDVRVNLLGSIRGLALYGAAPFEFGALRASTPPHRAPRIVLELFPDTLLSGPEEIVRFSLSLGEALRLSRRIPQLVDRLTASLPGARW